MCCGNSNSDCSCGSQFITNTSVTGPTGPQGPAGTTVLVWSTSDLSTATTGSDVLLYSTNIAANTLTTNGSEFEVVITGTFSNNSDRAIKIDLNASTITTVCSNAGLLVNGAFKVNCIITRVSNTTTEGWNESITNSGATHQFIGGTNSFVTDFTAIQSFRIYVNQSVASSITITSIKIKRAVL